MTEKLLMDIYIYYIIYIAFFVQSDIIEGESRRVDKEEATCVICGTLFRSYVIGILMRSFSREFVAYILD